MTEEKTHHASHLFAVRIWPEELGPGRTEWRGQVEHVLSGERRYFRDWPSLRRQLNEFLGKFDESFLPGGLGS